MSEDPDVSDRRSSPRIAKVHLVQVNRFDEEGFRADLATGRTLNISSGGVRLELHHSVPLRSLVKLNLVLGVRLLDLDGMVVYLQALDGDRCCMGIEFIDVDAESKALLEEFVGRFEQLADEDED